MGLLVVVPRDAVDAGRPASGLGFPRPTGDELVFPVDILGSRVPLVGAPGYVPGTLRVLAVWPASVAGWRLAVRVELPTERKPLPVKLEELDMEVYMVSVFSWPDVGVRGYLRAAEA